MAGPFLTAHVAAARKAAQEPAPPRAPALERSIVLVGLMGVGKTTVGRGLAAALAAPFCDTDHEIERAADRTVAEIFAERGEPAFRDGERRVIARLLGQDEPHVLAFGGGAFLHPETRALVRERAVSVWLTADIELLARRVSRRATRPLLHGRDPAEVLRGLALARDPIYAQADLRVSAGEGPASAVVAAVRLAVAGRLRELRDAGASR